MIPKAYDTYGTTATAVTAGPEETSETIRILADLLADRLTAGVKVDAVAVLRDLARAVESITQAMSTIAEPRVLVCLHQGDYHTEADIWYAARRHLSQAVAEVRLLIT
jgi:hypothetical protein